MNATHGESRNGSIMFHGPWLMSLSYRRDAAEELSVVASARKRFAAFQDENFTYLLALFFIAIIAAFFISIEVTRRYSPFFPVAKSPGLYYMTYFMAVLPLGVTLVAANFACRFLLHKRRIASQLNHIKAIGYVDIEIYEGGLIVMADGVETRFEWRAVQNVSHTKDMILLDMEQTAVHIPERAFEDRMTMLKRYKEIRLLWHDSLMDGVAKQDMA